MRAPRVSILLSVHEPSAHLAESLDSLRDQTLEDYELLVVNDGGSEELSDLLRQRAAADGRIRVLEQERSGLTRSLNKALREARGRIVARQDADDVSLPARLESQLRFLEETGADLVSCYTHVVDQVGRPMGERRPPTDADSLRRALECYNCLQHSSIVFRRERALELGGYREEFRFSQDYDLYLRALLAGWDLRVLGLPLLKVRMTPWNITTVNRREQVLFALAAQCHYFASCDAARPRAWRALRHHLLRVIVPDGWRKAKRQFLDTLR